MNSFFFFLPTFYNFFYIFWHINEINMSVDFYGVTPFMDYKVTVLIKNVRIINCKYLMYVWSQEVEYNVFVCCSLNMCNIRLICFLPLQFLMTISCVRRIYFGISQVRDFYYQIELKFSNELYCYIFLLLFFFFCFFYFFFFFI